MLYLLHFDPPYKHARHYLGFTRFRDVERRVKQHQRGQGGPLTRAAVAAGVRLVLAVKFDGDRRLERKLKRSGHVPAWCPLCQATRTTGKGTK